MIITKALTKKFGELVAVNSINLHVSKGEIFGLLGPNGAGKTTTISMLSTILEPTSGTAKVAGYDIIKERDGVRNSIGIVFQDSSLDEELTGYENLDFHGRLYGMNKSERQERIMELLELVDLKEKKDNQVKYYQGGMRRRLEIARGLMHKPKILFLDEPTLGLDPQTRRHIWEYIQKMNNMEDTTVLLTTHYMEEANFLCDRVAIIDHGKIIALDKPSKLKSTIGDSIIVAKTDNPEKLVELVKHKKLASKCKIVDKTAYITTKNGEKIIPKVVLLAQKNGLSVESITTHAPTLEDVFIELTGRQLREEEASTIDRFRQRVMARRRR